MSLTDAERTAAAEELAKLEQRRGELRQVLGLVRRARGISPSEVVQTTFTAEADGQAGMFGLGFIPWAAFAEIQGDGLEVSERLSASAKRLGEPGEGRGEAFRAFQRAQADAHRCNRDLVRRVVRSWELPDAPPVALEELEYEGARRPVLTLASVDELDGRGWIGPLAGRILEHFSLTPTEKKS